MSATNVRVQGSAAFLCEQLLIFQRTIHYDVVDQIARYTAVSLFVVDSAEII